MSDPAVEAARKAWGFKPDDFFKPETVGGYSVAAAREALEPIRELHRKSPLYANLADDCEICSSDDDAISEQHHTFESVEGEWLCTAVIDSYCCAHCTEIQGHGGDDPIGWPCETARLAYTSEELER